MLKILQNKNIQAKTCMAALLILTMMVLCNVNVDADEILKSGEEVSETGAEILSPDILSSVPLLEFADISDRQPVVIKGNDTNQTDNRKTDMLYVEILAIIQLICFGTVFFYHSDKFILYARRVIITYIHNVDGAKS